MFTGCRLVGPGVWSSHQCPTLRSSELLTRVSASDSCRCPQAELRGLSPRLHLLLAMFICKTYAILSADIYFSDRGVFIIISSTYFERFRQERTFRKICRSSSSSFSWLHSTDYRALIHTYICLIACTTHFELRLVEWLIQLITNSSIECFAWDEWICSIISVCEIMITRHKAMISKLTVFTDTLQQFSTSFFVFTYLLTWDVQHGHVRYESTWHTRELKSKKADCVPFAVSHYDGAVRQYARSVSASQSAITCAARDCHVELSDRPANR